jgi:hypothetical protein
MAEQHVNRTESATSGNTGCSEKSTSVGPAGQKRFEERIYAETRRAFEQAAEIVAEAGRIRMSVRETEEELLRWETRVRSQRPIGTRWAEMLAEAQSMVAKASLKLASDLERQREALACYRAAHASLRIRAARKQLDVTTPALSAFARSERLRADAIDSTQLALEQSEAVLNHEARQGPVELFPVLASRRRLFADAETSIRAALNAHAEAVRAADRGITKEQWKARELEEEVERLRAERIEFEKQIRELEKTKSDLEKARDAALALVREEECKVSVMSAFTVGTDEVPSSAMPPVRRAPSSVLEDLD